MGMPISVNGGITTLREKDFFRCPAKESSNRISRRINFMDLVIMWEGIKYKNVVRNEQLRFATY